MPKHLPLLVGAIRCLSLSLSRQLFYLPVSSLSFVAAVVSKTLQLEGLLHRSLVNELSCPCYHALRFVHWMSSPSPDPTEFKEVSKYSYGTAVLFSRPIHITLAVGCVSGRRLTSYKPGSAPSSSTAGAVVKPVEVIVGYSTEYRQISQPPRGLPSAQLTRTLPSTKPL